MSQYNTICKHKYSTVNAIDFVSRSRFCLHALSHSIYRILYCFCEARFRFLSHTLVWTFSCYKKVANRGLSNSKAKLATNDSSRRNHLHLHVRLLKKNPTSESPVVTIYTNLEENTYQPCRLMFWYPVEVVGWMEIAGQTDGVNM